MQELQDFLNFTPNFSHLEVHPNYRKNLQCPKYVKLVFRLDVPSSKPPKNRLVKLEVKSAQSICFWLDEFLYGKSTERVKDDFLNQLWLRSYLEDDSLVLSGEIRVTEYDWSLANASMLPGDGRHMKMVQDIRSLTSSGHFSDFTFVVQGRELEVHKAILAGEYLFTLYFYCSMNVIPKPDLVCLARSPVFERMFTGSFKESRSKKQEIKDISADTFEEFLYYIYAGDLRNPDYSVVELITVADRYEVSDLMKLCEMKLLKSINDDNAEDIYRIANQIQCNTELKTVAFAILQS